MRDFIQDPKTIEQQSMTIIDNILGQKEIDPAIRPMVKRVIHTTADFDFADITVVSPRALPRFREAFTRGNCPVVTDTRMIAAGISRRLLEPYGSEVACFVDTDRVQELARDKGITRSMANIRVAAEQYPGGIYLIGNAPTALFELLRLVGAGSMDPALVVGVPVGFVGAEEAKEDLMQTDLPYVCTRGRKGGSPVAVAVFHALLQLLGPPQEPPGKNENDKV